MRLIICGNGFDIHHNLKTRYEDYRQYLLKNEENVLERMSRLKYFDYGLDSIKNKESIFWTDVERNLSYDFWNCVEDLINNKLDEAHKKASKMSLEDILDDKTEELPIDLNLHGSGATSLQNFSGLSLYRWFRSIDLSSVIKDEKLHLNDEDFFITFNYTSTLEKVYSIPCDHILYIHGKLNDVQNPKTDSDVHNVMQFGNPNLDISLIPLYLEQAFIESDLAYQAQPCIGEMKYFFSLFTKNLKSNVENLKKFVEGKTVEVRNFVSLSTALSTLTSIKTSTSGSVAKRFIPLTHS